MRRTRSGFTLLEVIVALAINTMIISACYVLVSSGLQSRDVAHKLSSRETRNDNILRDVRRLVRQFDMPAHISLVTGDRLGITHWSWCEGLRGTPEPCRVALIIRAIADTLRLELAMSGAPRVVVPEVTPRALLYLEESDSGRVWRETWSSSALPRAIGIDMGPDTLLLPVGRGAL